jgi:hypothetical protein
MTAKELARLVYNMRRAQKQYFKTRGSDALEESKRLEKEVDSKVKEILWGQSRLFACDSEE